MVFWRWGDDEQFQRLKGDAVGGGAMYAIGLMLLSLVSRGGEDDAVTFYDST